MMEHLGSLEKRLMGLEVEGGMDLSRWRGRTSMGRDHTLREPAVGKSSSQSSGSLEMWRGETGDSGEGRMLSLLGTKATIR